MLESLHIELSPLAFLLFAVGGILTGIINTLAGSGSLITLPIFMFVCGMPAQIANGTNRVGALAQTVVGLWGYKRAGLANFKGAAWLVLPAVCGAVLGARLAVDIDEVLMRRTIGALMVFMFFFLLLNPKRWIRASAVEVTQNKTWKSLLAYFCIGVYGGFIQAGMGIFLLAALVLLSKYSLKEANAVKILIATLVVLPSFFILWHAGQIEWGYGILMAIFQSIGAWFGVRFVAQIPNADVWIYRLLLVIVAAAAVKLFLA